MSLKRFSVLSRFIVSLSWIPHRFHHHHHHHRCQHNNLYLSRTTNFSKRCSFNSLKKGASAALCIVQNTQTRNFHTEKNLLQINVNIKSTNPKKMDTLNVDHAILRYEPGSDRFQFSFTLNTGKTFNFDRPTSETIESFEQRIVANMLKKIRKADVTAKITLSCPEKQQNNNVEVTDKKKDGEEEQSSSSTSISMLDYFKNLDSAKFQVNDSETVNILVNPPEIFQMKFRPRIFSTLPLMPCKVEASSNFVLEKSLFKWESTTEVPTTVSKTSEKGNKKTKQQPQQQTISTQDINWTPIEYANNQFILIPNEDLEGSYIRVTCTPSNGETFGLPLTVNLSSPVEKIPVKQLIYEERLARLLPIDNKDPNVLRFVTYNILADCYATVEWFKDRTEEELNHDYRLPLVFKEIDSYKGDIICLQEVDEKSYWSDMEPFFKAKLNYSSVFSCKIGSTREGVACIFNSRKLNLLEFETIDIGGRMKTLDFWEHLNTQPTIIERLKERNTIAQISVLENKNVDESLIILLNTHLYFHPNADHIRLLQMMVCIQSVEAKLKELKEKFPERKIRVFFCGDYNCTPPYSSVRLLLGGKILQDDLDWTCFYPERLSPGIEFKHNLNLKNSHPGEELTNIVLNFEGCIDYILYQHEQQSGLELLHTYPPPSKSTLGSIIGCEPDQVVLPNFYAPSDHLPLIADFKIL